MVGEYLTYPSIAINFLKADKRIKPEKIKYGKLKGQSFGDEYAVGDVVTVSLIEVDEDRRRIDFRLSRGRH